MVERKSRDGASTMLWDWPYRVVSKCTPFRITTHIHTADTKTPVHRLSPISQLISLIYLFPQQRHVNHVLLSLKQGVRQQVSSSAHVVYHTRICRLAVAPTLVDNRVTKLEPSAINMRPICSPSRLFSRPAFAEPSQ